MSVAGILDAIEQYLNLRREFATAPAQSSCNDWDCGLANELDGYYGSAEQQERLDWAKGALEKALNDYVDSRIQALCNGAKQGQS